MKKLTPIRMEDPTRDEAVEQSPARLKAQQLLCEILPPDAREQFLTYGYFDFEGKRTVYRIFRHSQTEIYLNGFLHARACLQLTIPAPSCDRMIAEYLILRNDETLYWSKANIEAVKAASTRLPTALLLLVDAGLLLKLILDYVI